MSEGGPAASQLENSRPALAMTRGVHIMAELSVLPLACNVLALVDEGPQSRSNYPS